MEICSLRHGENLIHLLLCGQAAAAVDPGAAGVVVSALRSGGHRLELILVTHHHADHTGGVAELKSWSGCRVAAPAGGVFAADERVHEGDILEFSGISVEVLAVPGHTENDCAYYLPDEAAVFTGDVLFGGGCGRVFGGKPGQMWTSLCRLAALPDDTRVYPGHDYTLDNLEFAAFVDPDNDRVRNRLDTLRRREAEHLPFEPATMADERSTNPFLGCRDAADFARMRARKDGW